MNFNMTIIERFKNNEPNIRKFFEEKHPESYFDIVKNVIENITSDSEYKLDPERIHKIDDGDDQGTLVYVIAEKGYRPSEYYYVRVYYGTCPGCDTIQGIRNYSYKPSEKQIKEYMMLSLHIAEFLTPMNNSIA